MTFTLYDMVGVNKFFTMVRDTWVSLLTVRFKAKERITLKTDELYVTLTKTDELYVFIAGTQIKALSEVW